MSRLVDGQFGSHGKLQIDLVNGALVLNASDNEGNAIEGAAQVTVHSDVIIDLVASKLGSSPYIVAAANFIKSLIKSLP